MSPVNVISMGSYHIGGKKITIAPGPSIQTYIRDGGILMNYDSGGDFQAGQMYVQYIRIANPVLPYPVCMIHGGGATGAVWESTQDGGPGWEFMFLQNGFHVNVSDGVERGRASWAQFPEINECPPLFHNYEDRWTVFRFGPQYGVAYEGLRFDISKYDDLMKQQVPRWLTSDAMVQAAYDEYVGSMTDGCILLTHSQGAIFALNAALKYPQNVKGIILVESSSALDVSATDVSCLKNIPILFVWGDFLGEEYCTDDYAWCANYAYERTMWKLHSHLQEAGGDSTWMHLPKHGVYGNSHVLMVENNSRQIADMICDWIRAHVHMD